MQPPALRRFPGLFHLACLGLLACSAFSQTLRLPARKPDALGGTQFAAQIAPLSLEQRENRIRQEILAGNVPDFLRTLIPVPLGATTASSTNSGTVFVTPDYLAIGSADDYFLVPMSPSTAQAIADLTGCSLPTRKLVDSIYHAAPLKLSPAPMKPGPDMVTVAWFSTHNLLVSEQRKQSKDTSPLGTLTAGHKKDLVITPRLETAPGKVAIYGWHQTNGLPIQPLYLGHTARWVDYSHGVRLVQQQMTLNGASTCVSNVLSDPARCSALSDERPFRVARYNPDPSLSAKSPIPPKVPASPPAAGSPAPNTNFSLCFTNSRFGESVAWANLFPATRVYVNLPATNGLAPPLLLVYALPNGNTLEHTLGKTLKPGDDWHFDIQHVLAQTRFLRQLCQDRAIALACLQSTQLSWPSWRKTHGNDRIPSMLDAISRAAGLHDPEVVLNGHSGGGSFIFGFINAVPRIPPSVTRIAFLDSNYAYDPQLGHTEKLVSWLKGGDNRHLTVIAYNDAVALLNGRTFVSTNGGTWGRSHAMHQDLSQHFTFSRTSDPEFQKMTALHGRVQFILKENPERKIFHTVQVEKNGLIHSLLCGTTNESKSYTYFGPRAYTDWISPD